MSLYEPFGVGNLLVSGGFRRVEDRVVPNDACADPSLLRDKLPAYPTVPDFLTRFERREMPFARAAPYGFRHTLEAVFLDRRRVMACEATLDGTRHYFLGQRLRRLLREQGESVVRGYEGWAGVVLDTRTSPFNVRDPAAVRTAEVEEFREGWEDFSGFSDDYLTLQEGLLFYPQFEGTAELIGTLEAAVPIGEYFEGRGRAAKRAVEDGMDWETFGPEGIFAARRDAGHGRQVLLTREGYRHLRERDFVVVRATRPARDSAPEKLSLVWSAQGVSP